MSRIKNHDGTVIADNRGKANGTDGLKSIKTFNRFTIISGRGAVSVHNETFDISHALKAGLPFGAYIVVGGKGATVADKSNPSMDKAVCVKKSELSEYNTDLSRGEAFAVFNVVLTDSDIAEGTQIGAVGLSHDTGGAPLADFAEFTSVTKEKDTDIVIKAEVRLKVTASAIAFTAGDNGLARVLLGIDGLKVDGFEMAVGTNYHSVIVMPRSTDDIAERQAVLPNISSEGISFSSAVTVSPYEVMLLYGGKVVMRGAVNTGAHVEKCTATLRENFSAEIADKHIVSIANVLSSGEPVGSEYDLPRAKAITADCPQIMSGRLNKSARFLAECTGKYFAVRTDKSITVYGRGNSTFVPLYKVSILGGVAVLLPGGGLMVANGTLYRYKIGADGTVDKVTYSGVSNASDVSAVIGSDRKVDFILVDGGTVTYRRETADGVTENTEIGLASDDYILGRSGKNTVYYASKNSGTFAAYTYAEKNSAIESRLRSGIGSSSYSLVDISDCWMRIKAVSLGVEYVMPISRNGTFGVGADEKTIFCGNYCLSFKDGKLYRCMHITAGDRLKVSALDVGESVALAEPIEAITAGDYILLRYDGGQTRTIYPVPYGRVICCPDLDIGDSITFDAVVCDDPLGTATSARVTIKLSR